MKGSLFAVAALLCVVLSQSFLITAQQQSGVIEGVVVRVGTREPISGAELTLTGVGASTGGIAGGGNPIRLNTATAITDGRGRFVFRGLGAGTYRLTAAKDGHVRQEYGQRVFSSPGTPIVLAAGQSRQGLEVLLTPGGNVSGRIRDSSGQPVAGMAVQLLKPVYDERGARLLQSAGNSRTDDLGQYRIYWITPGHYYLVTNDKAGDAISELAGGIGRNLNALVTEYGVFTFYPGVTDLNRATVIDIQSGADRTIDLNLAPVPRLYKVRGKVVDSMTGQAPARPPGFNLSSFTPRGEEFISASRRTYDAATGVFEIPNVAPGRHTIWASLSDADAREGTKGRADYAEVNIVDSDVDGVVLNPAYGISISGHLTIEDSLSLEEANENARRPILIRLSLLTDGVPGPDPLRRAPQMSQPSKDDGTFALKEVMPGEYRVSFFQPLSQSLYLKAVRFNQTDVLNDPIKIVAGASGRLDIVLSTKAGQVEGIVIDPKSPVIQGAQVVLIPNRNRNRADLYKVAAADPAGKFSFSGVAPGDYKVFAWEGLEQNGYFDSETVMRAEPRARAVHVEESSKQYVEVNLIPANLLPQ